MRQSGVLPYRIDGDGELELLLVTSTSRARWIVPKGHIEPDLTARASAAKEAFEEAGVIGAVDERPLGSLRDRKGGASFAIDLYAMEVALTLDEWPEKGRRRRRWFDAVEAATQVHLGDFERCVETLRERIHPSRRRSAAA
jgi:8-oxo-dGTP pyrophosphatase MutT (NUDIX family)